MSKTVFFAFVCSILILTHSANRAVAESFETRGSGVETSTTAALLDPAVEEGALKRKGRENRQRFVEFRGEFVYIPGNTVIRHGFLGPDGEPEDYESVSYQADYGVIGLVLGSIIPLPAKVGVYPWDDLDPPMNSWRVNITKKQHDALKRYIAEARARKGNFYLYTDNCTRFAKGAALAMGMNAPDETFVIPPVFITMLKYANGQ